MKIHNSISISLFVFCLVASTIRCEESAEKEFVLTLDHTNFTDTVSKHDFIVVEFYAPWCGHCKNLAPEYEKAASTLSSHDPQIVLAKVDANEEANKELATKFEVQGFPTLKIIRNGGKSVQEYNGPREAEGIVTYLKKQSGPASAEIKSSEDAASFIDDKKVIVVGVFPKFSGEEYENFIAVAEKLRSEFDFAHSSDAKYLPRGDLSVSAPVVRLFKPFDELNVDSKDFNVEALEKFVRESSTPLVTIFDSNPENHPYVNKFFENTLTKVMMFMDFKAESADSLKSKYFEAAKSYRGDGLSFLLGDAEHSQNAFQYFGLKESQAPLIVIQNNDGEKYLKTNVEVDQIAPWFVDFKEGKAPLFKKSEPIPTENNEPVKVVVGDSIQDMVLNSEKNVFLEFYAPWCGHCKNLAPILDEVAVSYESDPDVVIAKLDATTNDFPQSIFDVKGFPTLYLRTASGKIVQYSGGRTKDDIIDFIEKNKDKKDSTTAQEPANSEPTKAEPAAEQPGKDEL